MGVRRRQKSLEARKAEHAEVTDPTLVLEAALRFLEARQRSAAEVRRRLLTHGYRADLVEGCLERLTELGMIDDAAFARAWVESRDRARPRGERALRQELARKGIDNVIREQALAEREVDRPDADEGAARRLLERHANALARVADPRARRQRAYALLARNGFDSELATQLTRSIAWQRGDRWSSDALGEGLGVAHEPDEIRRTEVDEPRQPDEREPGDLGLPACVARQPELVEDR
jgi:regulatory protein